MADRSTLELVLTAALLDGDTSDLVPLLADDVVWGECHSVAMVVDHIAAIFASEPELSGQVYRLADRFVVDIESVLEGEPVAVSVAVFHEGDQVVEIHGPTDAGHARVVARAGPFEAVGGPVAFASVAPVFPVGNVETAAALYRLLGFEVGVYDGPASYAYASRGEISLHLAHVGGIDPKENLSAAYLYVSDAKALFAEWRAAATAGRLHAPTNTDYGLCEGAFIDPDGNLLRFGSHID